MVGFQDLLPDFICDVVSNLGLQPTGQLFQLNSYENRVYQVGLENEAPLVIKFYRPNRWTAEQIKEEHFILDSLYSAEIPVVKPIDIDQLKDCKTLGYANNYYYCLYPKFGGHEEADLTGDRLSWLGRTLARTHNVMSQLPIQYRIKLNAQTYGYDQLDLLFENEWLPDDLWDALEATTVQCLHLIEKQFESVGPCFAVHGDCHLGNVLWNQNGPTLVDFDDAVIAPAVQDVWMLFWGTKEEQALQHKTFFKGYEMFRKFDRSSLRFSEALRTLRMIRHTAWIGQRFEEAIFQRAFSYYSERNYWERFLLNLKEQCALLQEF